MTDLLDSGIIWFIFMTLFALVNFEFLLQTLLEKDGAS